jgi:hypothetical protein
MNTLYFFKRQPDGSLLRWRVVIDDQQVIVEEGAAPEQQETVAVTAAGGRVITSVSPQDRLILGFFVESTPCWFDGCETLRKAYLSEVSKLGSNCPACQKGAIIRKYQALVNKAIETPAQPTT